MTGATLRDWTRGEAGLVAYHCDDCLENFYFERAFCPACGGRHVTAMQAGGAGQVEARTLVHRAPSAELRAHLPYAILLVRLVEGFMVMGQGDPSLHIGDEVRTDFISFGESAAIPFFIKLEAPS